MQFVLVKIINDFGFVFFLENWPCVKAQKHLGTVPVPNHTIVQSQQLARLHVSNPTVCISQALAWQEWQCLHRGSSVRAVNFIRHLLPPGFSLSFTAHWSSSSRPQQPCFLVDFSNRYFLLSSLRATTSAVACNLININAILVTTQTLQWLFFPGAEVRQDTASN